MPLLTLFLFGIVQFGLAYDKKQSINSAAREGARVAALPQTTVAGIEEAVRSSFLSLASGTVDTTVHLVLVDDTTTPPSYTSGSPITDGAAKPCSAHEGDIVVVTAEVQHVLTIPFFGAPELTLTGEGEFRCEREV